MLTAGSIEQSLLRAQSLAQAGRMGEAWAAIAPAKAAIWNHGQGLRLYAYVAQGAGQTDAAIAALERIIETEQSPPPIVGALADTLGKAGRHDEAYRQWSRLVALDPTAADAHLNRAVSANAAGLHDQSIAAADDGLARFPGHARLLAVRALALRDAGRIEEAMAAFETAVAADPARARTRLNQAVTLNKAQRFVEADAAFGEAKRLGGGGALLESNWGAALFNAGRVEEAVAHLQAALSHDPFDDEARRLLTIIAIEHRGGDGAFDHYRAAAERAGSERAWVDYLQALLANKRYAEAAATGSEVQRMFPASAPIILAAAFARGVAGEAAPALAEIDDLPREIIDRPEVLTSRAQLALRAGDPARAAAMAERVVEADPRNQLGWAVLTVAWRLTEDLREHWLCDYERLVMVTEVPSPDGALDAAAYAKEVAAALEPLHGARDAPGDQSLTHGTQTSGALFDRREPAIQRFRQAVIDAAALAVSRLPDDPTHPFLRRKSTRFDFSGSWSVRLLGGEGHHVPHFHGQGWMSSAYYARLPSTMGGACRAGWIEFGRPPAMYALDLAPRRVIQPEEGRLVLFPSYLWHGTIPFPAGDEVRLTAAFDYQPL